MGWLLLGVVYSAAYAGVGWLLRDQPVALAWFRAGALLVPPLTGAVVIVRRRHEWSGCQWLFWSTIALGLAMSAIGLTGWAADELVLGHGTWLAWPSVFALFGSVAPLFALLAQPHRGPREPLAATTAVDIAGLAVVTGFLYSFFVTAPLSSPLLIVSELQQALVVLALGVAMFTARRTPWHATYRRLALGAVVSFVTLTMSNVEAQQGIYRTAFVYDFTWILPFAFFPWAAVRAPRTERDTSASDETDMTRPRPWVIFTVVALLPFLDFALRHVAPDEANQTFRDMSTAIAIVSVLPLLVARIAAEKAELQQAGSTMKLLAQVIEQAQDLILVLTPDGRCRHANSAFCRAMGLSPDELTHLSGRDLMARDGISADDIQSVVRAGGTWRGTMTRTRRDGTTFTSSATVAALLDDRGDPTHIVSVERDISEERRLREQLIHSERLSAVGQLVAGVAHELNNPLQGLMGLTELLINAETRPETRSDLELVRHDGERAAAIVKNLLAFARRSALERSVADLNEIARSSLALRAYELRLAGTTVRTEYADDLPMIVVNREEIQQIVLNLIMNAEHALRSTHRPGSITLRTTFDGEFASLEVSDDGPGVPADLVGRIFEPFFTTKGVGEGTGLGLSVSLGIAEAHNGTLELLPSARGARFALTLPAGAPGQAHQAVMAASKMDASSSAPA
jgi:PAS domain S-box-containing protein